MEYDSLLKVVNNDESETVIFGYANQVYPIKPGRTGLVPFEAVKIKLGDPRTGPEVTKLTLDNGTKIAIANRSSEMRRLSVLYGIYDQDRVDDILAAMPNVTVTNLEDDSTPIVFPAQDPKCTNFTPMDVDQSQMAMMQRQLEKMRRTQLMLEEQIKAQGRNIDSTVSADKIQEDMPHTPTRATKS